MLLPVFHKEIPPLLFTHGSTHAAQRVASIYTLSGSSISFHWGKKKPTDIILFYYIVMTPSFI